MEVAHVDEYQLTAEPQKIADNAERIGPRTYVVVNMTAAGSAEYLGVDQALGDGLPIPGNLRESFDLPGGEVVYAAAPDADNVVLRVMELAA